MDINELPSPQFMINEAGMISVFLPAFAGEPKNPTLTKKDETTLHFQRSADGDILLTEISADVMDALAHTKKILVVEANLLKSIDMLDKALSAYIKSDDKQQEPAEKDIMDTIERAYEITVNV